ncbi:DNA-directed DNA polymerase [Caerostris darwini]|uniref:DNA-directed DNA polymerase n=1 Tax=Caerostris darwini TaxID=1538125 RepID=A0AAV4PAF2_9ARAC|nr:DNA-directed DNA polymerase [Caerostris darwini]
MCCKVIRRNECRQELHRCGTTKCPSCNPYVIATEHFCYLKKNSPKRPNERLIFFDFETDQSSGEHIVNFALAQYADGTEKMFNGYSACENFCAWLFTLEHKGFTAIAHNMKGFDGQFIMAWILKQGITPDVIPKGGLIMSILHPSLKIRIIDSLNFLPMPLSKIPDCFGFKELRKSYFPHLFNIKQNQNYGGAFPEARFYSPDSMGPAAREKFLTWYEDKKNKTFNFQEEMDADILRRCLEFRSQFQEITQEDPFQYVTIASACMAVFRSLHVTPNTIAMVPIHGYVNDIRYSPDSIRWLDFVSHNENIIILHALNGTDSVHPLKGISMATVKEKTDMTSAVLRSKGYQVVELWEHEFAEQKKKNPQLQKFLESHSIQDRLNPRDAFFGGRTNALKLFYEGSAKYVDFTSLYPWINKYFVYPIGHPEIITKDFKDVDNYFGLILCRVIPPRALYLPVLPFRCQGKLMFPLCRICTENMRQTICTHSDEERALTGTWMSEEVKLAKRKVYIIAEIKNIYLPSEEVAAIQWQSSQDFVKQDTSTNIFIAAFTAAWARLKLYQEMDKLGENVLYHDTDSIIYASDGMNDPTLGNFLGEFTDELEGDEITIFVSGKNLYFTE